MRGSKATKLRRFAVRMSPQGSRGETAYLPLKSVTVTPKNHIPIPGVPVPTAVFLGHVRMIPQCLRSQYQNLKKAYKAANQHLRRMT